MRVRDAPHQPSHMQEEICCCGQLWLPKQQKGQLPVPEGQTSGETAKDAMGRAANITVMGFYGTIDNIKPLGNFKSSL